MKPIVWNGKKVALVGGACAALTLLLSFVYGWLITILMPENALADSDLGVIVLTAVWLVSLLTTVCGICWWICDWLQKELKQEEKKA